MNPFNLTTSIKYTVKEDVFVRIVIYDILGKEVKKLVDEYQEAGFKYVRWDATGNDGTDLASGIYFYKLTVKGAFENRGSSFEDTKKLLIIK